jgi:hypothetical protein
LLNKILSDSAIFREVKIDLTDVLQEQWLLKQSFNQLAMKRTVMNVITSIDVRPNPRVWIGRTPGTSPRITPLTRRTYEKWEAEEEGFEVKTPSAIDLTIPM